MEAPNNVSEIGTEENARQAVEILLKDLHATFVQPHDYWLDPHQVLPPPRLDIMNQIIQILQQYPNLAQESYPVEDLKKEAEEKSYSDPSYYDMNDDDKDDFNKEKYNAIMGTSSRSILYYFLKNRATLEVVQSFLGLSSDKDELVGRYNSWGEISSVCFACKYCTHDVIEYFIYEYPESVTARCILQATRRGRNVIPLSTIEAFYNVNTLRPFNGPRQHELLHYAVVETWPEQTIRQMVQFYSWDCFHATIGCEMEPSIETVSAEMAEILSPLFLSCEEEIQFPRVNDPRLFIRLIRSMMHENFCKSHIFLEVPCVADIEDTDERERFMTQFKQILCRTRVKHVIHFRLSDGESEDNIFRLFRIAQDAIIENERVSEVKIKPKMRNLTIEVAIHPLMTVETKLTHYENLQLDGELRANQLHNRSPLHEKVCVPNRMALTPFITNILSHCHHPTLELAYRANDATQLSLSLLQQHTNLVGYKIGCDSVNLVQIFALIAGNATLRSFTLGGSIVPVTGATPFQVKANKLFLTYLKNGIFPRGQPEDSVPQHLHLCEKLFEHRKADAATYYYLLLNRVGCATLNTTSDSGFLLAVLLACRDVPIDSYHFEDVPMDGEDRSDLIYSNYAGTCSEFNKEKEKRKEAKIGRMRSSLVFGILRERPALWTEMGQDDRELPE